MILETIGSLIVGAIGAGIGWGATEFVARPVRKFFDLRADVVRLVSQYDNIPALLHDERLPDNSVRIAQAVLSETEMNKHAEAEGALRALAAQMRGFAYNETIASRALQWAGYDPRKASEGLFGIANTTINRIGDTRIMCKKMVTEALRLPEHTL